MIILVASTKGGVGKSTIAANMAVVFAKREYDVLLVDADRQSSCAEFQAERKINYPDYPKITVVQRYGEIDDDLESLSSKFDFTVVDVSGRDSSEMRSAMLVADTLLVPVRPSQFDLSALHTTVGITKDGMRINKKLRAHTVLSIVPTNPLGSEFEAARSVILEGYPELKLMDVAIRDRKIYRDSIAVGLGVVEVNDKADSTLKAQTEIRELVDELLNLA